MKFIIGLFRRPLRLLLALAGLCALYSLLGFLVAPALLRRQLAQRASAALHRPVSVRDVQLNPWTFRVAVRGLAITAPEGDDFAGWEELHLRFLPLTSLLDHCWTLEEIRLVRPHGRLERDATGRLSIEDMMPPASSEAAAAGPAPAPQAPPSVTVQRIRIEDGEFSFTDHSRGVPFTTKVGPATFELVNFTTRPNRAGDCTFAAATEAGERLSWQGQLTFQPLGSTGHVSIEDLRLPKYLPYHRELHRLDLLDGRLGVGFDYEIALAGGSAAVRIHKGRVEISDLSLAARGSATALATVPRLELNGIEADSAEATLSVAEVLLRGATVEATRQADGSIDWLDLIRPSNTAPAVAASTTTAPAGKPFAATVGRFAIENATLRLNDRTTERPVELVLDECALTLSGLGGRPDQPLEMALAFRCNGSGRLALRGAITALPLAADLQLDADELALRPFDPYLAPFVNLHLTGGAARAHGRITFAQTAGGQPALGWDGDIGFSGLATIDAASSEPLAGFADLALHKLRATTQPLALTLDEINLQQPDIRVVVHPDKRLNLMGLLKASPSRAARAPADVTESGTAAIPVKVGRLTIAGGRLRFTDQTVSPELYASLADFGGSITGLSSEQWARADVELTGRIGVAPLRVAGKINPLGGEAFTDITVVLGGAELPPFSPYSGRFAGYTIDKGKLGLELAYRLSAHELVAENRVVLDQFYLGQQVESPDAVHLPLKLALAILRDRDGRIAADLPIRGRLDDPDFKYGRILWGTLRNVLVKAATAPFAVVGDLFGNGHDLSAVDFGAGSSVLEEEGRARLDGLARALVERPGLRLEISSLPQPERDIDGLRVAKLEALLRTRKLRDLAAGKGSEAIDPAKVVLTPADEAKYLAELCAERCQPAAGVAPAATSVSPASKPAVSPARRGGLVARTFRRLRSLGSGRKQPAPPTATAGATADHKEPAPVRPTASGVAGALSPDEMRSRVLATIEPTDSEYVGLAAKRAKRIQHYLLEQGKVDPSRIFLVASGLPPAGTVPRVVFRLQ
jgi:uncharacterized protein involved in outer membrane biogenesis